MNDYIDKTLTKLRERDPYETEFHEAVQEVFASVGPVLDAHPEYRDHALLERMIEPDRIISFRVVWMDDHGQPQINRGWRVQFNGAIGPYKGGLRFAENLSL
ncbi:MAG: NADP-specific glutamate dehydrogenase, partial [Solobacterium sp.]|nr:NADP-specific glutamate dehydrogenase [Solobacterium sp.]